MAHIDVFDEDFLKKCNENTPGYTLWNILETKNGAPVIIQMSDSAEPPHWYIQNGSCSIFYFSFKEVTDYIKKHGLIQSRKYNKKGGRSNT